MTQVKGAYQPRSKLTAESLDRLARVVVRVLSAGSFDKPSGRNETRVCYWLSTREPPDYILFLTSGDLREMVERLGDETDDWLGKRVVLELVNRSYQGRPYEKYAVAPATEWDDVLRPLKAPPPSAKRTAKKTGRKPRRRKK